MKNFIIVSCLLIFDLISCEKKNDSVAKEIMQRVDDLSTETG
jgi:hypothetical protein